MATYNKFTGLVNFTGTYEGYVEKKGSGKLIFATISGGTIPQSWYADGETGHTFPIYVVYADSKELVMPSYHDFSALRNEVKTKIQSVKGESNELNNSLYVNVKATSAETENGIEITLSSTVKTVDSPSLWDKSLEPWEVTGLATDGYVNDSITNALTWDVQDETLDFTGHRS